MPKGNFTINYLPHHGVLDEGEGLEDNSHVGVEDPVDVSVDLSHGLKICFIFAKLRLAALRGTTLRIFNYLRFVLGEFFHPRFSALLGSILANFVDLMLGFVWLPRANCTAWYWLYRCTFVPL